MAGQEWFVLAERERRNRDMPLVPESEERRESVFSPFHLYKAESDIYLRELYNVNNILHVLSYTQ